MATDEIIRIDSYRIVIENAVYVRCKICNEYRRIDKLYNPDNSEHNVCVECIKNYELTGEC